jgi:hypothetical protein
MTSAVFFNSINNWQHNGDPAIAGRATDNSGESM